MHVRVVDKGLDCGADCTRRSLAAVAPAGAVKVPDAFVQAPPVCAVKFWTVWTERRLPAEFSHCNRTAKFTASAVAGMFTHAPPPRSESRP